MILLKCKMCGGDIQTTENQAYGTCDSCGSTMTLPKVSDERKANLYNRANHYRQQNEFDKALATYESILAEDANDAEAHWGIVLSKYGIEYVEDPKTHERIPTCHRVQVEPILSDLDYKAVLENSIDGYTQSLYEQEAKKIAEIQKTILMVSSKAEVYDVFICYKETDATGQRTVDSTIAQDIYYQLNKEGLKIFFARITLEDKLGREYEPYIFAALNSAKVMLVVGTKQEHFNAVWVKNEWARFAALAKMDREKVIIPCYRDMDAYDLPDELSFFQSQDMSKIGFVQDLVRGIGKLVKKQETVSRVMIQTAPSTIDSKVLLKRGYVALESGRFDEASIAFDKVLDVDAENSKAYWGKMLASVQKKNEADLLSSIELLDKMLGNLKSINDLPYFQNAIDFSYGDEKEKYINISKQLSNQLCEKRKEVQEWRICAQKFHEGLYPNALVLPNENFMREEIATVRCTNGGFRSMNLVVYKDHADILDIKTRQVLHRFTYKQIEKIKVTSMLTVSCIFILKDGTKIKLLPVTGVLKPCQRLKEKMDELIAAYK